MNWSEANDYCLTHFSSRLASIDSQDENYFIYRLSIQNGINSSIWIGLNDINNEGNWEWVNGKSVVYTNWHNNLPHETGSQDCVEMIINPTKTWQHSTKWNDRYTTILFHTKPNPLLCLFFWSVVCDCCSCNCV